MTLMLFSWDLGKKIHEKHLKKKSRDTVPLRPNQFKIHAVKKTTTLVSLTCLFYRKHPLTTTNGSEQKVCTLCEKGKIANRTATNVR